MRPALRLAAAALAARPWRAGAGALAIAALMVPTTFLAALGGSIERRMASIADPRGLLVLAAGAAGEAASVVPMSTALRVREETGIAMGRDGEPLVSPELVLEAVVGWPASGSEQIAVVRGLERPGGSEVHEKVVLREGRWPSGGALEVALGATLQARLGGVGMGEALALGGAEWQVVGVFEDPDGGYGGEAWTELATLTADAGRLGAVSVVRVRAESREGLTALAARISGREGASLEAVPEMDFRRRGARALGVLRAAMLLIGMLAGSAAGAALANVVYASVDARRREIGVLRALGFARRWVVGAVQLEALFVAGLGLAAGILAAAAAVDGLAALAPPSPDAPLAPEIRALLEGASPGDPAAVALEMQVRSFVPGALLATVIGVLAALGPAWRAARISPAEILRRE